MHIVARHKFFAARIHHRKPQPKNAMTKLTLSDMLHPAMLALMDEFVSGCQALRAGVTIEQQRATLETDAKAKASYDRKMARMAALLAGPGGFSLGKHQHKVAPALAADVPAVDVLSMLQGIANKGSQPGA